MIPSLFLSPPLSPFFPPSSVNPHPFRKSSRRPPLHTRYLPPRATLGWQGWQETIFGPYNSYPALSEITSSFPSLYGELFLLGLCAHSSNTVYATLQTIVRSRGVRAAYALSSQALPLPLSSAAERLLVKDMFAFVYGTPGGTASRMLGGLAFASELIPEGVTRALGVGRSEIMDAGRRVLERKRRKGGLNRAEGLWELLGELGCRVVACSVEEVEHLGGESLIQLGGFLFVEHPAGGALERMQCSVVEAVVCANVGRIGCFMERAIYDGGCVRVKDMIEVFEGRGAVRVLLKEGWCEILDASERKRTWRAEELKAEDVLGMDDNQLRAVLTAGGVGSTKGEGKMSLLRKLVVLMDEVERREVGIWLAAESGMYGVAAQLQRGRSKRGLLMERMREAEREGKWGEVVRLGSELKMLESQIADITAEPGSYNRDLDQDEWYRPNR